MLEDLTQFCMQKYIKASINNLHSRIKSFDFNRQYSLGCGEKIFGIFRGFIKSVWTNKSDVPSWIPYPLHFTRKGWGKDLKKGKSTCRRPRTPKTCLKYFAYVTLWSAKGVSQRHVLFYHWLILLDVEIPLANISSD